METNGKFNFVIFQAPPLPGTRGHMFVPPPVPPVEVKKAVHIFTLADWATNWQ